MARPGSSFHRFGRRPGAGFARRPAAAPQQELDEPIDDAEAPELAEDVRALFDLTPPHLIAEIITEEGSYRPEEIAALVDRTPFLREGYELLQLGA